MGGLTELESYLEQSPRGHMNRDHPGLRMLRAELTLNSCTTDHWEMEGTGLRAGRLEGGSKEEN